MDGCFHRPCRIDNFDFFFPRSNFSYTISPYFLCQIQLLVKPLLMSMQNTQNRLEQSMIYDKTVSVFRTKLCQSKEHPRKDVDRDEIHQVMKDILEMAKRSGKYY